MNKQKSRVVTIEKAIQILTETYAEALTQKYINKPLAWSLYQTWKIVDGMEKSRNENR